MIKIVPLKTITRLALADINHLLPQLSVDIRAFSLKQLRELLEQDHLMFLVAKEQERIVGMALLFLFRKSIGWCATIEDVVVDRQYRGRGIGKLLMEQLIAKAKKNHVSHIDLTSRPERKEANEFYQKLGFKKRETNVYRLKLL